MVVAHTREKILNAAEALFFADGIAVTGVDRVADAAGVSVVTLYKHMGSKDGLLAEVLQRRLADWDRVWQGCVDATDDERAKVLAIFDAIEEFRQQAGPTQWCTFLATASERPPVEDSPGSLVRADTQLLLRRLQPLAQAVDPLAAAQIVDTTVLLYNGVLASLLRGQPPHAAAAARRTACVAFGWTDLLAHEQY
ncbi:MAG: TetR/AcrR family transcriptional regulator [Ornithinimicrobium sp.]